MLLQWVQSSFLNPHILPLGVEGVAVGRKVVLPHWEGVLAVAQCGDNVESLLLFAVENMDVLNLVGGEDIYLHVGIHS